MIRLDNNSGLSGLDGARVLVVGVGRSGVAATRLAADLGASVTVTDRREDDACGDLDREFEGLVVQRVLGGHPLSLLDDCDLIVLSPGVPLSIPLLLLARERSIPVWSEIELASRACRGKVIGVTGSNGKSTVTTMIGAILGAAGRVGGIGGNLATPFSSMLEHDSEEVVHALELSSFQLETTHTLQAAVAVLTNFTPDHMDRYDDLAGYGAAKARLFAMQTSAAVAIYNADDPEWARFEDSVQGRNASFSVDPTSDADAVVQDEMLRLNLGDKQFTICAVDELSVVGAHNVANALAAALACAHVGVEPTAIRQGLLAYRPLPHRLEAVRTIDGIDFYNDSKATNPEAAVRAVEAFPERRIHWILGGRDKDGDWSQVVAALQQRDCRVLLVGEATEMLSAIVSPLAPTRECGQIDVAVREAVASADRGDVILLAPGCASFDQFRNFEQRGECFRSVVLGLQSRGDDHA